MQDTLKAILLTGAGFSHDFGGYLANDLWAVIFNHPSVQRVPLLRLAMQDEAVKFNFELVYDKVVHGSDFADANKQAMIEAVNAAYAEMDRIIQGFGETPATPSLHEVRRFIQRFAGTQTNPGFFFTLNQDLFVERRLSPEILIHLPHLRKRERFTDRFRSASIDEIRMRLPSTVDEAKISPDGPAPLFYVKLHGSFEWISSGGEFRPVIGTQKTAIIREEPILVSYSQLFAQALRGARKLVIIGYRFADPHINGAIAGACRYHGLEIYIVTTDTPDDFVSGLEKSDEWRNLREHWAGFYRCPVRELFSLRNEAGRQARANLERAVFAE